jgi:hypothetical protein
MVCVSYLTNGRVIGAKGLEGSGFGVIEITFRHLPRGTEGSCEVPQ